jgi:formylglycine-generating enzyme required for sulfatase activity
MAKIGNATHARGRALVSRANLGAGLLVLVLLLSFLLTRPSPAASMWAATPTPINTPQLGSRITDAKGIEMVYVPAGLFMMGNNGFVQTMPAHRQAINNDFWLDLTVLINAQYAAFVAAGGYQKREYWTAEGWAWLQAKNITGPKDESAFTAPDQPRVNISWYEAYAYGQWRGVRLPTEVEWEWAARGPESRIYPWGDEFINNVAVVISVENFMGTDTKIGADIRGASWVDALDMVGIVGQWTSSLYQPYPYQAGDKRENLAAGGHRVVRGCGYACSNNNLRGAFRSYFPSDGRYTIGVRYVRPLHR